MRIIRDSRRAIWLACVAGLAVIVIGVAVAEVLSSSGNRSDTATVNAYIRDLNAGNAAALQREIRPGTLEHANTLISNAKLPWAITRIHIAHDFGPHYATAELTGAAAVGPLHVYLPMLESNGSWYITTNQ